MTELLEIPFRRPGPRAWVRVGAAATAATVRLNGAPIGRHLGAWTPFQFELTEHLRDENLLELRSEPVAHATAGFLPTIGVQWCGARDVEILPAPAPVPPAAEQRSSVSGTRLLVDGRPFRVRGILHWGYYPELGRPWPSEQQIRREIEELKALGFNLIKFCLWIPPARYYELCDELEMLVWQEYPLWNHPLADPRLFEEYEEFFCNDRSHACVILRTLTCENDRVDPMLAERIIARSRELIPGVVILDNSGWLCAERCGDFHDEHIYLNNMQWVHYRRRMEGKLDAPLLLGETMVVDSPTPEDRETALAVRRFQIERFARDFPDAGYVVTAIRDLENVPLGLQTADGTPKYRPEEWSWHGRDARPGERIPSLAGPVIGPRKGEWKCPENTWWSPVVRVLDPDLPADLIRREAPFELLSGRVLAACEGTRVLVELQDVHSGRVTRHPLVIEFTSEGERRVVSALRHDTAAGRIVLEALATRRGDAPEIGPLNGDSIVLEEWEMSVEGRGWIPVRCDTPLVNEGRNVFEGWATFRTTFPYPGGERVLRCEAVGDFYEIHVDGACLGEAGNRTGTWDGTRDIPREFPVSLPAGRHEIVFRVRDWRGAGGMVGPVYMTTDVKQRIF